MAALLAEAVLGAVRPRLAAAAAFAAAVGVPPSAPGLDAWPAGEALPAEGVAAPPAAALPLAA